ncbi:DHH family phosphoesterase [Natrarchaeobius oligotrophus]|uniref:Recombinase RecJ n=1 Tax=Natrarchaeobius chitinivorans TaxID=1679083 RepID=A0A3N6P625_NATCH|nr:hypothetical protein [Natrarchaeobius chitinivorans]RQG93709.1 hypothetical protein EA472_22500 [Natrarchaeobius chitinivorans]
MIDDELLSREQLGTGEWAVTPKPEHLVPDSIARERDRTQFRSQLADEPVGVIVTHTDADGLGSAALLVDHLQRAFDAAREEIVVQPIDYDGAYRFEHVVEDLQDAGVIETPIYISDFNLDELDTLAGLETLAADQGCPITWFDHHQWSDDHLDALEDAGVVIEIDDDECATSLIARELGPFDDRIRELAECTKDIDLWIRDDPRSEFLNVYASMVETPWQYISVVLEHGPDLPDGIQAEIDERLERDRELEQIAVENRSPTRTIEGYDVVCTYSRGGRSSTIGNELVEEHPSDYDVAIVMKTHGGIGIYSHSDRTGFVRCHEVAEWLGGGGHPTAAGCSAPVQTFRELADYWKTRGASVREEVIDAVHHVASSERLAGVSSDE